MRVPQVHPLSPQLVVKNMNKTYLQRIKLSCEVFLINKSSNKIICTYVSKAYEEISEIGA